MSEEKAAKSRIAQTMIELRALKERRLEEYKTLNVLDVYEATLASAMLDELKHLDEVMSMLGEEFEDEDGEEPSETTH